jgi:hypothetical protein
MWYAQLHNISDEESYFCEKCDNSNFSRWKNIGDIYEPCKSERTCLKCNHKQIIIKHQWDNDSIFCNNCGDIQSDGSELAEDIKQLDYNTDKSAFEFMTSLENKLIYIDSNIFMGSETSNDEYDITEVLFDYLYYHNVNIILFKEQYSEIYKLKQNKENKNSSFLARRAFKRIEQLLNLEKLTIDDLDIENLSKSYADPIFIKKIISDIKNNKKVVFITEDADLRIRLKSQIKQQKLNKDNLEIYSLADIEFLNISILSDKLVDEYWDQKDY